MNRKSLILILTVIGLALAGLVLLRKNQTSTQNKNRAPVASPTAQQMDATSGVPAHYEAPPGADKLTPTLPPEEFTGPTRAAYQVVREIPQTIAEMPCYCHCDRSLGHKSLHSCFEDDHAAHCAVCTGEALMAYQLQKQGLNPRQIRDRIIAAYSQQ